MTTVSKYSLVVLMMISLTACLEVKDNNNNDDLVSVLQQQNEILTQQNDNQNTAPSLTLTGKVTNVIDGSAAQNATVMIKIGSDWSEPVAVANDGNFDLTSLSFSSDYTLLVQSSEQDFLSRVFYGTTRLGSATGVTFQEIGLLSVSKGQLKSIAFLDAEANTSILGLELYAHSHVIQSTRLSPASDYEQYFHRSTYNEATEQYEIMLPTDIDVDLYGSLDLNGDGENDYLIESSNYYYDRLIPFSELADTSTVYLVEQQVENNIEFRIAVLDNDSNILKDLTLSINDQVHGEIFSTFDEVTEQYVITANLLETVRILLPAFSIEGQAFESGQIIISPDSNEIDIITYGYNRWGNYDDIYYSVPIDSEIVDVVFQTRLVSGNTSDIKLVTKTNDLNANKTTYKAFYSQPIDLLEDSVVLLQENVISVLRGNESNEDLILAGTTVISANDVSVPVTAALSLNNTLLTVVPESELQGGYNYRYYINNVVDRSTELAVDIDSDDSASFSVVEEVNSTTFDINTLILDNGNYYNNGELIIGENTAGEQSDVNNSRKTALLLIPNSATRMLKSLTIQRILVTAEGDVSHNFRSSIVIADGQFSDGSTRYALNVANNENIVYDNFNSYSVIKGLAIPEGLIRYVSMNEYMYDNTSDSENSMTFEYAYETLVGEVFTGQLILKVQ